MATNRDLLKEAIADARAVKETAIANAKAALEEVFTPYLKEILATKINEIDETDETMEEMMYDETEVKNEMMDKDMSIEEEVSLEELLAELEEEKDKNSVEEEMEETYMEEELYEAEEAEEEMSIEDMSEEDLKSFIEDVIKDMVAAGELEAGEEMEGEEEEGEEEVETEEDEEIDLEELLSEEEDTMEEELDEVLGFGKGTEKDFLKAVEGTSNKNLASKKKAEYEEYKKKAEAGDKVAEKIIDGINKHARSNEDVFYKIDSKTGEVTGVKSYSVGASGPQGMAEINAELEEAYSTIETLKSELQEINLLNAKLLYTNKIFRNKSLTESQKIKVLTAFDKAASKKEVELVYETLQESLKVSTTKAPIKESLGSASKVLGNASAKPIIEVDNQFARWQQLAGIKK